MFGCPTGQSTDIEDYVDGLQERLLDIHEFVRESLNIASNNIKDCYDLKANSGGFQDDKLWLFNPQGKKGKSPKLTPVWERPSKVVKRINDVVYRVQRSPKGKMKIVHLDRFNSYHGLDEAYYARNCAATSGLARVIEGRS